ncbi:CTB family bacteriocin [Nostoc sp.]|uniref:CTB family bacteriocin n=1 Tax=Nostoc sp. TaxID=1180 RepID=UPI002FF695E1
MSHNLFIDVTEEQQESVAGGVEFLNLETLYTHVSTLSQTIGPVAATSGPNGSSVGSLGVSTTSLDVLQTLSKFMAGVI